MLTIDHRGFDPLPSSLFSVHLDGSLKSDLMWDSLSFDHPHILWELDFGIYDLSELALASYQLAIDVFVKKIWNTHRDKTVGVVLYKGGIPPFEIEFFADYLHRIASVLPEEVPPFALFDCEGDALFFSKEIFPYIHLGFRSGNVGILKWEKEAIIPKRCTANLGVVLPLRERGLFFDLVNQCLRRLDEKQIPYLLIAEPHLTQEWDGLSELVLFSDLASPACLRAAQGFRAAGGEVITFGVEGFEPPTFCSQSRRASQAALYPEKDL